MLIHIFFPINIASPPQIQQTVLGLTRPELTMSAYTNSIRGITHRMNLAALYSTVFIDRIGQGAQLCIQGMLDMSTASLGRSPAQ